MGGVKKEYCLLEGPGETVLAQAARAFIVFPCISVIAITVPDSGEEAARRALPSELLEMGSPKIIFVPGGATRRASVHNALSALAEFNPAYALVHDGGRPWVSRSLIERVIEGVKRHGAVIPVLPLTETPKETDAPLDAGWVACSDASGGGGCGCGAGEGSLAGNAAVFVTRHLRRVCVGAAQTPQAFSFRELLAAHEKAALRESRDGYEYTDDAEVWGEFCGRVAVVPGASENRKITFPQDLR